MIQTLTSGTPTDSFDRPQYQTPQAETPSRSFAEIADQYWSQETPGSALDYLRSLSANELETIGEQHRFANTIPNLVGITTEGANNLLRPKG